MPIMRSNDFVKASIVRKRTAISSKGATCGGPAGQTEVVAIRIYQQAFLGQFQTGRSSAFAYMVLIVIIAISNLYIRNLNKAKEG